MKHVDAFSRNPAATEAAPEESVMRIEEADWVLSGQLTDEKIRSIREGLNRPPSTPEDHQTHKNYALKDDRVYRRTSRGLLWVIPRGMRNQVVRATHDEFGHFSAERTLYRLCQHYWFPRMRTYVERYIACCIPCLFNKKKTGKKEGYLHPIEKPTTPFEMVHVDHLGSFPKSSKGNLHILAVIDSFTKFAVFRPVRSTNSRITIRHLEDIFKLFGNPKILISDQGSSFTCKRFEEFCQNSTIRHVLNAVATPRANGQVERLNRTILSALLASNPEERK